MSSGEQCRRGRARGSRFSRTAAGALGFLAALASATALASRILYLARDEVLCDVGQVACVAGTLSYDVNDRLLWLHGRAQSAPGPGLLQIIVRGANRLGHVRYAPMEIALRGRPGEIVDFRMIPDYPDVANWAIDRIVFVPDPGKPDADQ